MKKWAIVVIAFVAVLFLVSHIISYWNSLPQASYKLGDEIRGFPVDEISITVWNYSVTNTNVPGLPLPNVPSGLQFVVFNVSIRNLENHALFFNQTGDLQTRLSRATSKYLYLELEGQNLPGSTVGGASFPRIPNGDIDFWGIALNESLTHLGANERVDGFIYFLKDSGLTSKELVCKSIYETKPIFVVNLK